MVVQVKLVLVADGLPNICGVQLSMSLVYTNLQFVTVVQLQIFRHFISSYGTQQIINKYFLQISIQYFHNIWVHPKKGQIFCIGWITSFLELRVATFHQFNKSAPIGIFQTQGKFFLSFMKPYAATLSPKSIGKIELLKSKGSSTIMKLAHNRMYH